MMQVRSLSNPLRIPDLRRRLVFTAVMLALWGYAWGCTSPPDNPPDTNTTTVGMPPPGLPFVPPDPSTGRVGVYVGLPVNLFAPQVPTT